MNRSLAILIHRAAEAHAQAHWKTPAEASKMLYETCVYVCNNHTQPAIAEIVYYLLKYTWNESIDWAETQLK